MKSGIYELARNLTRVCEAVCAVLLFGIVLFNLLQVFFRYVVSDPLGWTEEYMRYSVAWMVFLGANAAIFRGEHMVIDLFPKDISPIVLRVKHVAVLLCIGAFCFILVWKGIPLSIRNAKQVSPTAQVPMIVPYISVGIGGFLMLVNAFCLMVLPPDWRKQAAAKESRS